jgi:hypothetical protein
MRFAPVEVAEQLVDTRIELVVLFDRGFAQQTRTACSGQVALRRPDGVAQGLQDRSLPEQRERFRCHCTRPAAAAVADVGAGQRQVQFGGAPPEEIGDLGSDELVLASVGRCTPIDRKPEFVERLHPQVALVSNRVVNDHDVGGFRLADEIDGGGGGDTWHPVEPGRSQVAGEFDVGVHAGFETSDQLGDQRAVDDHRGVRLFDREHLNTARVVDELSEPSTARSAS